MTNKEKQIIIELRKSGLGYGAIATELGISKNAVSAFCRRLNIETSKEKVGYCKNCGTKLVMIPKHKAKVFCSDKCRIIWWKQHSSEMQHRNIKTACCIYCENEFNYYGKRQRKYCSRKCYLNAIKKDGFQDE